MLVPAESELSVITPVAAPNPIVSTVALNPLRSSTAAPEVPTVNMPKLDNAVELPNCNVPDPTVIVPE